MVWYGVVWCGMEWYGMLWYDMVWYGMPIAYTYAYTYGHYVDAALARRDAVLFLLPDTRRQERAGHR